MLPVADGPGFHFATPATTDCGLGLRFGAILSLLGGSATWRVLPLFYLDVDNEVEETNEQYTSSRLFRGDVVAV